jgi:hypothetical protein
MLPFSFIAIIFTVALSLFLNTTFHSFKDFNHQVKDLTNWQETALASAKRVRIESSTLLDKIKSELNSCLEVYSTLETQAQRDDFRCDTDFISSVDEFKTSLKANYSNQLTSTISYGLNPDNTGPAYESYSYELFHSDKLPSAFNKGDDLYNSALVTQKSQTILLDDFDDFLDYEKLSIDPELLETLIGKDNYQIISQAPENFNLSLNASEQLQEDKLPNAIKLVIKFKQRQSVKHDSSLRGEAEAIQEEKLLTKNILAVAQIKTQTGEVTVNDIVCNTCNCPNMPKCPIPPPPPPEVFNTVTNKITFGQFDNVSGRGIFFDNSQPASFLNQINIVNTDQGRFTSVYPGAGDYLQISIGTFPRSSSVLLSTVNNANQTINPKQVDFATVNFTSLAPPGQVLNITGTTELNVDIVPRARKRYMTAQKDFRMNGQLIPKGTILVGTLEPNSKIQNPRFSDLSNIRAYDPESGALIQIFKPEDKNKTDCPGDGACMQINQFTSSGANPNLKDSTVSTSFSTSQLFPGKDSARANELFVNIQRDLEVNSNMGIYNARFDWQEDILKDDLNGEQKTLITETLKKYNLNDSNQRQQFLGDIGFAFLRTGDKFLDAFKAEIEQSFVDFVVLKGKGFQFQGSVKKEELKDSKNDFINLRSIYQDLMKAQISKQQANNRIQKTIGRSLIPNPPIEISSAPQAPTHPGLAPVEPEKPVCSKPKSNACKNKKSKYKNQIDKYNKEKNKYDKKLDAYNIANQIYQVELVAYNKAYAEFVTLLAEYNKNYG